MQPIIERTPEGSGIHVLIVSVGRYDSKKVKTVTGSSRTTRALFEFWRDEADARRVDGFGVATVTVLATGDDDQAHLLKDDARRIRKPHQPTERNVQKAFAKWIERVRADGVGIMHWTGHGGRVGTSKDAPTILYCSDAFPNGRPRGIDWDETEYAIMGECDQRPVACFIDACRSNIGPGTYFPALASPEGTSSGIFVHFAATDGKKSHVGKKPVPKAQFAGGPIFTNAVIDALDRYGAKNEYFPLGPAADPEGVAAAAERRASRIHGWVYSERRERGDRRNAGWDVGPILRVPNPECMIDVVPPKGEAHGGLSCTIESGPQHQRSNHPPVVGKVSFQNSVPWGAYDVRLADGSATLFSANLQLSVPRVKVTGVRPAKAAGAGPVKAAGVRPVRP